MDSTEITKLLEQLQAGEPGAKNRLLEITLGNLRQMATSFIAREGPGKSIQAGDLLGELYLRLFGSQKQPWQNRKHFYAAAGEAMKRILVDQARARMALKRGGDGHRVPLEEVDVVCTLTDEDVIGVAAHLEELAKEHPRAAEVVHSRFFAGLSNEAIAKIQETSVRTVQNDWTFARAWLRSRLYPDEHRS